MSRNKIATILRTYENGEMHLNNVIVMFGGGVTIERIIRQWMNGKISFSEAVSQISELMADK